MIIYKFTIFELQGATLMCFICIDTCCLNLKQTSTNIVKLAVSKQNFTSCFRTNINCGGISKILKSGIQDVKLHALVKIKCHSIRKLIADTANVIVVYLKL